MPSQTPKYSLEIPWLDLALINDRMRIIAGALGAQATTTGTGGKATGGGAGPVELVLSVPGTLSVRSNACPLVTFPSALQPSALVAMVKQAPVGADLKVRVMAGAAVVAEVTIPAGTTKGVASGITGNIPANSLVMLDVLQVGTTFPGSDLSAILQF